MTRSANANEYGSSAISRFTQSVDDPVDEHRERGDRARAARTRGFESGSPRRAKSPRRATSATTAMPVTIAPSSNRRSTCSTSSAASRHDRDLPRAPVPAREAARRDDEAGGERRDERLRDAVDVRRIETRDQRAAVLREDRVERGEQARRPRRATRARSARAAPSRDVRAAEQRAAESGERGGDDDRLLRGRGVERLVRRRSGGRRESRRRSARRATRPCRGRAAGPPSAARRAPSEATRPSSTAATPHTPRKMRMEMLPWCESSSSASASCTAGPGRRAPTGRAR